jgi:hypothetical protein
VYRRVGARIEFQGKVPSDYAMIPELYAQYIQCDEREKSWVCNEFKEKLSKLEQWLHKIRPKDESAFN